MQKDSVVIKGYHAHVYFDSRELPAALQLREEIANVFSVDLGRVRDQAYGPHPKGAYQIAFSNEQFSDVVQWLMLHRQRLDILVHPLTDDDLRDHKEFPLWLGNSLPLNLEIFKKAH
ncbi:DOPA 4,5-dioxygenase family protein [Glaciimonas soli]|uniref:4,5-dioxygenase n=1 Tax=Glaciimonas soli TaxID=2590999 RepID=A0A843YYS7_9BURK|nr:DOPA 4,5-dioxygenase family protein [Glaciimonas soli]MQR02421.1 4,5-dioxygenase [Glaciimonas soli]